MQLEAMMKTMILEMMIIGALVLDDLLGPRGPRPQSPRLA
jgi:hypothetical protein